jgi:response regulator RpfG family c-di-GMP phosphodiesterase
MSNKKILLVDDNKGQRVTLESILTRSGFNVMTADCGNTALSIAANENFAAALLDIKMPDITGIDVLKELKSNNPEIIVIMMTGYSETEYAVNALNAGAYAYIMKPANIEHVKSLLNQAIEHQRLVEENKAMSIALREWNSRLEDQVSKRTAQLIDSQKMTLNFYEELKKNFESTLEVLSIAIDQRDHLTSSHSFRVTQYALEIGKIMSVNADDQEKLRYSGLMHDLGKIEVKEHILCKDGSLTSDEYKEIQAHARGTFTLLSKFKFKNNLADVPLIASSHHERYDGKGYPEGLMGDAIPGLARILAVADVLDAITSRRHYRTAMSLVDALSVIKRESNGHFDPRCAEALFKVTAADFIKIHMAEFLQHLRAEDIAELSMHTLASLYNACQTENPTKEQIDMMSRFYRYYQGPVPTLWQGKISPAPNFLENH